MGQVQVIYREGRMHFGGFWGWAKQGRADLSDSDVVIQHRGFGGRDLTSAASSHKMTPKRVRQSEMAESAAAAGGVGDAPGGC